MRAVVQRARQASVAVADRVVGAIETGEFGADMKVALVNDGPATLVLEV